MTKLNRFGWFLVAFAIMALGGVTSAFAAVDADLSAVVGDTTGLFGTVKVLALLMLAVAIGIRLIRRFVR